MAVRPYKLTDRAVAAWAVQSLTISASGALVFSDPTSATSKRLQSNVVTLAVGASSKNLNLPNEAAAKGVVLYLFGSGAAGGAAVLKDSTGVSTICTLPYNGHAILACDGTSWRLVFQETSAAGFDADVINEITAGAGVTIDGLLIKDGYVVAGDNQGVKLGAGTDDTLFHNGTNTLWNHITGNLIFDNQAVTGATYFDLGTDTGATKVAVRNNSGTVLFEVDGAGTVTIPDGAAFMQRGKGGGTGDVIQQVGATATEAWRKVVYDAEVTPNAIDTNLINIPAGSMIESIRANVQAALTGGGTTVTWSIGTGSAGDPDKYGSAGFSSISGAAAADSLAKNGKLSWFGNATHILAMLSAAEQLKLTACATGGAAAGDTALTVGTVRVVVIYWQLQALDNAP